MRGDIIQEIEGKYERDLYLCKKYTIDDLRDIMVQLRGENGCPWDKVQTHQSIKKSMAQVFHAIAAAPEGAVLFHCALGKDRTGIVAAMLLSLAEVDRLDIIADYQISNTYLQPMFRTMVEDGNDNF